MTQPAHTRRISVAGLGYVGLCRRPVVVVDVKGALPLDLFEQPARPAEI
jgi:UDP-N-acetyl-D-mannosaminuronate dehydrogenase